jgi:hypothetical protein
MVLQSTSLSMHTTPQQHPVMSVLHKIKRTTTFFLRRICDKKNEAKIFRNGK